jgi:hypothetical protein
MTVSRGCWAFLDIIRKLAKKVVALALMPAFPAPFSYQKIRQIRDAFQSTMANA